TIYAGQNGADVLNLSLGGEYPNNHPDVAVIRNVMRRVQEEHGITIVAAAGNAGTSSADAELMPAESPGVIAAVATRRGGAFADAFSNFGPGMEVAAPGQNVLVARAGSFPGSGDYTRTNGTSFSSPLTAGTAALMKAADGRRTPGQIRTYLMQTVHEHPSLKNRADSGGIVYATFAVWASKFDDIRGVVFIEDIAWLALRDITRGCNPPKNTRFCPDSAVTRGQMAAFLTRALELPKPTKNFFGDDNNSVFQNDINRLASAGITLGCNPPENTRFCPNDTVTRGQMAAFLRRGLSN
ncbi:MAG: S8 family serine peptidase, partial [Acidimicrobiia bacterium]|nr:S8 family serine peptidase [Acidimicrobiia bacterium]